MTIDNNIKNEYEFLDDIEDLNDGTYDPDEMVEKFKDCVANNIRVINKIINADIDKMTDEEFWDFINKAFDVNFKQKHYLKMISLLKGKKFNCFSEIWSTMTFTATKTEGRGHDFSWYETKFQQGFKVAVSKGLSIDDGKAYSVEEIKQLIASNDLVLIDDSQRDLQFTSPNFEEEPFQELPMLKGHYNEFFDLLEFNVEGSELFPHAIQVVREKYTKKKILKKMASKIEELQAEINQFLQVNSSNYYKESVGQPCKNWFEESSMKLSLQALQSQTNKKDS